MGKSLAALFGGGGGNSKRISKLKTLLSLTVARSALLKNQHQARCSMAHSDIAQLLSLARSDRALLRAEIVVKEENMLDVFAVVQSYCHLIIERSSLLHRQKDCPQELKEAVSSLIYVSSRSAEMPELQRVCSLFSAMFGREFVRAATELRNSCGVNPKIVQKLSTRQPSLESRAKIIKEIAAEKGITLDLSFEDSDVAKTDPNSAKNMNLKHPVSNLGLDSTQPVSKSGRDSLSGRPMHSYKDVASAAQAAFEKAEDAAAAARVAVELSRSSGSSFEDHNNRKDDTEKKKCGENNLDKGKVHPVQFYASESEEEDEDEVLNADTHREMSDDNEIKPGLSSGFSEPPLPEKKLPKVGTWAVRKNNENHAPFDNNSKSDTEKKSDAASDEGLSEKEAAAFFNPLYQMKFPSRTFVRDSFKKSQKEESDTTGLLDSTNDDSLAKSYYSETASPRVENVEVDYTKKSHIQQSKVTRKAVSVRTRRGMQK
ncbi:uncharacterized protein A4U43_C03F15030 [Asparagus officinalis]|uniref:IST1-like protein n=1 Tax=Asparagus officinalis TaxID=4686 RepID=A0A5P1FF51_ASPOF|nr:uncharacterized protein LOC109832205 [Asparagus officinalis]ONK75261.1 uncharacterized protein A4U43_C03F15030 [Asparagus officinalis]